MCIRDWSSDVCSSDLEAPCPRARRASARRLYPWLFRRSSRQAPRPADRTEIFRGPAGDQTCRPRVQAWPPRLFGFQGTERKSVVQGTMVSLRVDLGGCHIIKQKKHKKIYK